MTIAQLNRLLDLYGRSVYGFCFHLTGNSFDADDLYQDTILRLMELKNRVSITGDAKEDYAGARNYCMAIAIRLFKHGNQRGKYAPELVSMDEWDYSDIPSDDELELDYLKTERNREIRRIVSGLPLKKRVVVYLFYYEDMPINEISKVLKVPQGTVKSRLDSARKEIKKALEEKGYGEN